MSIYEGCGGRSDVAPGMVRECGALLGIQHDMTSHGLSQSIPPAYTEWIGEQLVAALDSARAS